MIKLFRQMRFPAHTVAALASAALAVLLMSTPAFAAARHWNSRANPLIASDGGHDKAAGYGTWTIGVTKNGTRSQAYGYLKDLESNGKNVYFELFTQSNAGYCVQPQYTSCSADWYGYESQFSGFDKETWNHDYWNDTAFYASTSVNPSGDFARGRMQVSESNWGPDTHSGSTYTKGKPY